MPGVTEDWDVQRARIFVWEFLTGPNFSSLALRNFNPSKQNSAEITTTTTTPSTMSASLIYRRLATTAAVRAPAAAARPSCPALGLRFKSSKAPADELPPSQIKASDVLLPLSKTMGTETASDAEEAAEWLAAMREIRSEFTKDGTTPFIAKKAFAVDEYTDANIAQQAMEVELTEGKYVPTEAQAAKVASLKDIAIPVKTDETLQYLTNVIMRHGRKARAQRVMSEALYLVHLQTRQDPVALLKETLEKMSPVLTMKRYTDGGARVEMIPVPLNARQGMRHAWDWIVEGAGKRPSKEFSVRLGEEILAASKGGGLGFEKKQQLHKTGIAARSFAISLR